jgi:hypothetical protein
VGNLIFSGASVNGELRELGRSQKQKLNAELAETNAEAAEIREKNASKQACFQLSLPPARVQSEVRLNPMAVAEFLMGRGASRRLTSQPCLPGSAGVPPNAA